MAVPQYFELFNPTLHALRNLGGSSSIPELVDEVAKILSLSEEDLAEQKPSGQPQFEYRLAWARSYLKAFGLLDNSERAVWSLSSRGKEVDSVDPEEVKRFVRSRRKSAPERSTNGDPGEDGSADVDDGSWKEELLEILHGLDSAHFERLCQRVLRESGFTQVEVTGRTGDGGIDGTGTVKIGGLLSFPILFQCKKYQGSVGPTVVRDFRGAMVGRADRGLILTTGVFTREARKEANRDGAPHIDLVDRDVLLEKLKDLRLGVQVEVEEKVSVDAEWFKTI